MKKKRYFLSVVEEMIQNPEYSMFRGGRIEVYDSKSKSGYRRLATPDPLYQSYAKFKLNKDGSCEGFWACKITVRKLKTKC